MKFLDKLLGDANEKYLKKLEPIVAEIGTLAASYKEMSDDQLRKKTQDFKQQLADGAALDDLLPAAFALVREASYRVLGMRHYDVQLIGGMILHRGQIAEMRTGEGKTLVATLAVYLNAITGKGVHVVTVNDYLARRDAVWMGKLYHFLGLSTACIQHDHAYLFDPEYVVPTTIASVDDTEGEVITAPVVTIDMDNLREVSRTQAYAADITYGTNNEFGFDYLRDNMVIQREQKVQRPLYYAIVDEVDSILIDEARTPLIISAPAEESADMYYQFARIVQRLEENKHYNVDEKMRAATLTQEGIDAVEQALGVDNLYAEGGVTLAHHLEQAVKAKALFKCDRDYVVKDGEIIIVDEFTGRLMHGRRYSEGLHQAIEAKEGVDIQRESQTLATITFQNYFRMYEKLSGMTGTAATESEEFAKIYNLDVTIIPTNRPIARQDFPDVVYKTTQGKLAQLAKEVKRRHATGQPILIGTVSIEKNEHVSQALTKAGVPHEVLNAKNHAKEAEILAQAGRKGAVTVATNMAGRGVDIILGGVPFEPAQSEEIKQRGGLHVIGTERHESRRIDNQLRGRAGRQGDPGSSQFFLSMDDDVMRIFGSDRMKSVMERLGVPDDMPIENKMISRSIEQAQKKIEGHHFDIRKHVVEYDDVTNKHREVIYRKRNEVLDFFANDHNALRDLILDAVDAEIEQVVSFHMNASENGDWDVHEIYETVQSMFPLTAEQRAEIDSLGAQQGKLAAAQMRTQMIEYLQKLAGQHYEELEAVVSKESDEMAMRTLEKALYLRTIDTLWIEHLEAMAHMRTGIGLRGYGQRDPLVEFKKEAYQMFNRLMDAIQNQIAYTVFKLAQHRAMELQSPLQRRGVTLSAPAKTSNSKSSTISATAAPVGAVSQSSSQSVTTQAVAEEKVGRNEPCPCGSGKKYKKCHGR